MQNYAQEAVVDCQPAAVGVIDKAMLPELIHEMTYSRPGSAYHLCQITLTDTGKHRFGSAFLAEMRKQQENPGQTLFTRVEKLIDKVGFISDVAGKQMGDENFGDGMLIVEEACQLLLLDPDNRAVYRRASCRHAQRLTGKGVTLTLVEGLKALDRSAHRSALRQLRGKVRFDLDLQRTRR